MTTTPGMMGANFNPMMQGNMFSSQMFPLNGSPTASSMPQVTQLSQQMMGMNMGTTPTMYQPNPVVGPMGSNTQFIPGVTSNPSTMGNQAPAQVPTNPYMFLASGQTLSSNLWQWFRFMKSCCSQIPFKRRLFDWFYVATTAFVFLILLLLTRP